MMEYKKPVITEITLDIENDFMWTGSTLPEP